MQKPICIICAGISCLLLNGCVIRTVTDQPARRGTKEDQDYGSRSRPGEIRERRLIWIWEDDFSTPK